jgi:type IX secretion system PorP/SprF family membrane protein
MINAVYFIILREKLKNKLNYYTKSFNLRFRLAVIIIFFYYVNCWAQDAEFTQFYSNPLYYNPAFAGTKFGPRFILNFRDQWPNLSAYTTYSASYDQFFDKIRSGIGVNVVEDVQGGGIYNTFTIDAMYSYQIKFTDDFNMNIAMEGGYFQNTLNWADAVFYDQLNPSSPYTLGTTEETPPENMKVTGPDFGAGFLAYGPHIYFGGSVQHLITPKESFYNSDISATIPMRFSGNFGLEFVSDRNIKHNAFFSPNLIYLYQAGQSQLNLGSYFGITPLFIGMYFREDFTNPDAFILLAGFTEGVFKIAYSYDITVSGLAGYTGGAHEVSLIINLGDRESATNNRQNAYKHSAECPLIF